MVHVRWLPTQPMAKKAVAMGTEVVSKGQTSWLPACTGAKGEAHPVSQPPSGNLHSSPARLGKIKYVKCIVYWLPY